jgi:hypothetical protein
MEAMGEAVAVLESILSYRTEVWEFLPGQPRVIGYRIFSKVHRFLI